MPRRVSSIIASWTGPTVEPQATKVSSASLGPSRRGGDDAEARPFSFLMRLSIIRVRSLTHCGDPGPVRCHQVPALVVLLDPCDELETGLAGNGTRRDSALRDGVALKLVTVRFHSEKRGKRNVELTSPWSIVPKFSTGRGRSRRGPGFGIPPPSESVHHRIKGFLGVGGRENGTGKLPLARSQHEVESPGSVLVGSPLGSRALRLDDHERHFAHAGHPERLHHQGEASSTNSRHRTNATERSADRHVYRAELVLGLLHDYPEVGRMRREPMHDGRRRGHRGPRQELDAGGGSAEGYRLVARQEELGGSCRMHRSVIDRSMGFGKLISCGTRT